jgi:hypothetical protein
MLERINEGSLTDTMRECRCRENYDVRSQTSEAMKLRNLT